MSQSASPYWVRVQAELLIHVWEEGTALSANGSIPRQMHYWCSTSTMIHRSISTFHHIIDKNVATTYLSIIECFFCVFTLCYLKDKSQGPEAMVSLVES